MLLQFIPSGSDAHPPVVGTMVDVRTTWPEAGGQPLHFRGRIMRVDPGGANSSVGIALIDPDKPALRTLIRCAETQRSARQANVAKDATRPPDPATAQALSAACRDHVLKSSTRLAEDVMGTLASELSSPGPNNDKPGELYTRLEFLDRIRRDRKALTTQLVDALAARINNGTESSREKPQAEGGLSLLGNDELEEWLSVSEIAHYVETKLNGRLTAFEYRLAHLSGKPVDRYNNPYGPHIFAEVFQDFVELLQPTRTLRQTCFNVFKLLLTSWMEKLCRELNALLIDRGILPDLDRMIVQRGRDGRSGGAATGGGTPTDSPHAVADGDQDLYTLVHDLRSLQQQYGYRTPPHAHAPAANPSASAPAAHTLSAEDIMAVLARLRSDAAPVGELREHILSAVAAADGPTPAGHIGARESGIIDVADTLFSSMLRDGLVAKSVQPWLQRLELPLLKLAMQDDSIFVDRRHAAREVVNRIAQLELYQARGDTTGSALQREVDRVVEAISAEEQPDPTVFTKALKKLDLLIRMQEEAYAENLKEVLTACAAEPEPEAPANAAAGAEDQEWLKRVRRMKIGDWVLFIDEDPARSRRLRLAWISKHRDRYVFVNNLGIRETAFDCHALARSFGSGEAVVMDSADEPALDRAQYSMLQNLHRQLLHETTHDQLTGLMNRREFERRLQDAVEKSRCTDARHSLCQLDLAQFNVINQTCGNDTGDRVLTEIAQLIATTAGSEATTARIGADEFGVLIADCAPDKALELAQALCDAIAAYRFSWGDERMAVSAGFALVPVSGFTDVSALMQAAESTCRAARKQGVNRIQVYELGDDDAPARQNTLKWLNRIDKALNEGTLELRCQRIMPANAQDMAAQPHHSEVLLGITDDSGALVSPQQFILTAEHYQRMPAVDRWVVSTMFRFLVEHRDRLDQIGGFAINLSGCSLSDESFKDFIRDEIAQSGAPMEHVCFEITETAGITSLSDAADFILEIRKTGCRFSLDDFGSGLSSYVYLKNLPVDYLKIDGGFVRDMDNNPADYAVVRSITEIGHFMGKEIIAESVESEAVLAQLREIGVDYVQGYAIERPIRLREIL